MSVPLDFNWSTSVSCSNSSKVIFIYLGLLPRETMSKEETSTSKKTTANLMYNSTPMTDTIRDSESTFSLTFVGSVDKCFTSWRCWSSVVRQWLHNHSARSLLICLFKWISILQALFSVLAFHLCEHLYSCIPTRTQWQRKTLWGQPFVNGWADLHEAIAMDVHLL